MTHKKTIPCCSYPSNIVLLDDNISFLKNMRLNLEHNIAYKIFSNPQEALDYIHSTRQENCFINKWLKNLADYESEENDRIANFVVDVNIEAIHKEIYNPNRFDELSVVIADYAMPAMNGVDFFRELIDYPIKKLLITGYADNSLAVTAFNEGIINRFIEKDVSCFFGQLNDAITTLQHQYFQETSTVITNNLHSSAQCCFSHNNFQHLFDKVRIENAIVEYYLLDNAGSFLMLDISAKPYWFLIKTEQDMVELQEIAEENGAPDEIITILQKREAFPYFFTRNELEQPVTLWQQYMYPALKSAGNHPFYYSIVAGDTRGILQKEKILSYADYLQTNL